MKLILTLALLLPGCVPFTLTDINTGFNVGRTFDDNSVFASGKTVWTVNLSGHYTRDRRQP